MDILKFLVSVGLDRSYKWCELFLSSEFRLAEKTICEAKHLCLDTIGFTYIEYLFPEVFIFCVSCVSFIRRNYHKDRTWEFAPHELAVQAGLTGRAVK